jgi:hypothetical protein
MRWEAHKREPLFNTMLAITYLDVHEPSSEMQKETKAEDS